MLHTIVSTAHNKYSTATSQEHCSHFSCPSYTRSVTGKRAAVRAETTAAIIRLARQQVETRGAANLSLREIARDLDMASSAIYRYFESRDQLLTVLIIDAYDRLGTMVESADAACSRDDLLGRWIAIATSLRTWALANRADYGLVFGTPVPGYEAPNDTIAPAMRYTNVVVHLLADIDAAGRTPSIESPKVKGIVGEYRHVRKALEVSTPDEMLLAGLSAWAAVFGAINQELFGHVDTVFKDPGVHFEALTDMLGRQLMRLG
jgi:AcrR family transcriptional regulator